MDDIRYSIQADRVRHRIECIGFRHLTNSLVIEFALIE